MEVEEEIWGQFMCMVDGRHAIAWMIQWVDSNV